MHTCGQLTVFKAFFGLGTGTPPKATNQQKFVTRLAWTARVEVSAAFGIGAAPALFNHGSLTLGWFATTLVAEKPPREPGHWPNLECSCIRGVTFPGLERKPNTNVVTRHRSPNYGHAVFRRRCDFDGTSTQNWMMGKTGDSCGPI